MNRRLFLSSLVLASGSLLVSECPEFMALSKDIRNLAPGEVVIAEPGMIFGLPAKPKEGDTVQIVIDTASVENPSIVSYQGISILEDHESLILDSLGNIKLTYREDKMNWVLT